MEIHRKYRLVPSFTTALLVAVFSILAFYPAGPLEALESKTYDWRFRLRGARSPGDEIAIVAIDEKALSTFGRWPWSRTLSARLIDAVAGSGARVIGMDIIFSEPGDERSDVALERAVERAGNLVLPLILSVPRPGDTPRHAAEPASARGAQFMYVKETARSTPLVADFILPPIESLAWASAALGHIYTIYDPDGAVRSEPLAVKFSESYYPAFSLEAARLYMGLNKDAGRLVAGKGVRLGDGFIETDPAGRILVNYAGPAGTFPHYSAADLLEGRVGRKELDGRVVLIGTTALGTYDLHVTPYANMPGVEKQASVVENIIHKNYMHRATAQRAASAGFIAVSGAVLCFALARLDAFRGAAVSLALLASYLVAAYLLFVSRGLWMEVITPSLALFSFYASITGYRYMSEERRAREIRKIFSSYVTPKVVDELVRRPELARLGGTRQEVTVLFSDIRSFTSFSERHRPEEVVTLLNEYLGAMTEVVFRWEGTLDKFVGDEIMVFWGAPTEQRDHAELAVRCALDMIHTLCTLQKKWRAEGREPFGIGIGINTGEVLVGNIGAEGKKMDYTIIGDHVNLGARVEALTRDYDTDIIITEFTHNRLCEHFETQRIGHVSLMELDSVKVKGKERSVTIYSLASKGEAGHGPLSSEAPGQRQR